MPHSSVSSPSISSLTTTSDQWAALLRYDASRRDSAASSSATAIDKTRHSYQYDHGPESTPPKHQPKRLSLGDDLPHMPEELHPPPILISPPPPRSSLGSALHGDEKAYYSDDDTVNSRNRPLMHRMVTPTVFKGENSVLVDRELDRLRHQREKETKRHWRILTGASMLPVLGLCAYVLTQYVLAFLSLSPANWFLSDSTDGTQTSPDPLLRTLALIGFSAAGVSALGALGSGFYLRFSRRRSCGTWSLWIAAILSTTISIALCVINLALIAIWHRKYAASPNDSYAATRDVSRRCNGVWDLDILWSAAKSSPVAKNGSGNSSTCTHDGNKVFEAYLIAGGVRLALFVIFCSIWLACLARYNRTLSIEVSSNESIHESAEMHKLLLAEESDLPSMPTMKDITPVPGSYTYNYEEEVVEEDQGRQIGQMEGDYPNSTVTAPPPRLDRFRWQRNEPSRYEDHRDTQVYGNLPNHNKHEKEVSAGAWSAGVVGHVWNALWGSTDESKYQDPALHGDAHDFTGMEDDVPMVATHGRQTSRLGVRGWFQRDGSGQVSDDYGREDPMIIEEQRHFLAPPPIRHSRTPSQEKRVTEGRHAAARQAQLQMRDVEEGGGLEPRSQSRSAARERAERRKREQQDRIDFLANLGFEERLQSGGEDDVHSTHAEDTFHQHSSRRSSMSAGDDLPHMPELLQVQSDQNNEAEFWQSSNEYEAESRDQVQETNVYVRTLGKLVRKLSAIESVGSKERADRVSRSGRSASDLY